MSQSGEKKRFSKIHLKLEACPEKLVLPSLLGWLSCPSNFGAVALALGFLLQRMS
jgi:hypothetical protein